MFSLFLTFPFYFSKSGVHLKLFKGFIFLLTSVPRLLTVLHFWLWGGRNSCPKSSVTHSRLTETESCSVARAYMFMHCCICRPCVNLFHCIVRAAGSCGSLLDELHVAVSHVMKCVTWLKYLTDVYRLLCALTGLPLYTILLEMAGCDFPLVCTRHSCLPVVMMNGDMAA